MNDTELLQQCIEDASKLNFPLPSNAREHWSDIFPCVIDLAIALFHHRVHFQSYPIKSYDETPVDLSGFAAKEIAEAQTGGLRIVPNNPSDWPNQQPPSSSSR